MSISAYPHFTYYCDLQRTCVLTKLRINYYAFLSLLLPNMNGAFEGPLINK